MSTPRPARPTGPLAALARQRDLVRRWFAEEDRARLALLVLITLLGAGLMLRFEAVTAAILMVPLLLTGLLLSPRHIPVFVGFLLLVLFVETLLEYPGGIPARRTVAAVIVLVMSGVILLAGWRRNRLGVGALTGEALLTDLQARINRQGQIPPLPTGWFADAATRSAGSTSFAGDFLVAHRSPDGTTASFVLVDVSGKGVDAGPRSLLLSGALGALLGSVPPDTLLPVANAFVLDQAWDEGFATAVHVCVELTTGGYEIRTAGHPPAIQFRAGSGQWHVHDEVESPVLGLVAGAEYPAMTGRLGIGDALLLYTDGLVERRRRDISLGIDKLVGEGERLVREGFGGSAQRLITRLGATNDDCAVLVLQRGFERMTGIEPA